MKSFDKNAKCTKCGSTDIHAQYHETRYCTFDCPGWKDRDGEKEHIARCCRRCSYSWLEAPLDSRRQPHPRNHGKEPQKQELQYWEAVMKYFRGGKQWTEKRSDAWRSSTKKT